MAKFNFPQIKEIKIRNFSLYNKSNKIVNVEEKVANGIFCLAGANGLGKSTFLNIINYGFTGLVMAPGKIFFSPGEIYDANKDFTDTYFDGRIKEKEKEKAEVELLFNINKKYYRIVRGFFEKDTLREFEIYELSGNKKIYQSFKKKNTRENLNEKYKEEITKDMGLMKYEYFIFLQFYVLTFDENRRLLFWDDRSLSNALSISFNNNLDDAEALIKTMRDMEKHESKARNQRWQAKQISDEINKITENYKRPTSKDEKSYLNVCNKLDEIQKNYDNLSTEYDTLMDNRNYLYSDILDLEIKYKEYFSNYSEPMSELLNSPYIQMIKDDEKCLVCGAKGKYIVNKVIENIHKDYCPLCNTSISNEKTHEKSILFKKIKNIDSEISEKRSKLDKIIEEIVGKELIIKRTKVELEKFQKIKNKMERDYPQFMDGDNDMNAYVRRLREQYKEFDKKSKESYEKRDRLKPRFNSLERKIKKAYSETETVFVPVFRNLAKSFIGYDLEIRFVSKNRKISLVLDLDASARTESHKLSESQRFFLDIALRMALAIYLSTPDNEATLFIDTPEGSLDIAYENRVGKMFAEFINSYSQNILMTANINSSQLLISLAKDIKKNKMGMKRMLDWIDLSVVQISEEKLFKKYFDNVESILRGKKI
jgi:DNA repair exonuclease SbcCD ATPase subunit